MNSTLNLDTAIAPDKGVSLSGPLGELQKRLDAKTAVIGVVGLGYVGLPLAVAYARKGFRTHGFDLDSGKLLQLEAGSSYIQDVPSEDIDAVVTAGNFSATDDFSIIEETDIVFVCVPTPVTENKDPDTTYIRAASEAISRHLRAGHVIILKSTTFPNTTEHLVQPILARIAREKNLQLGEDYALAFSPERIDPGNRNFHTENTPVVVGGVTKACTTIAADALREIINIVHPVSSPRVAEMEKLLENIFRSVNIALANELARLCDRMGGISMWEVVDAAATKPFGFMPFYPGPGLGGHCIPIDPYYLSWLARKYDFETSFITLSARVNEEMPFYVASSVLRAIAEQPVALRDANVLIMGVAFKRDVDDIRHSPALRLFEILSQNGVRNISYSDPHVPKLTVSTGRSEIELESMDLTEDAVSRQNVVVIVTDHSDFPYEMIARKAQSVIDTRNAMRGVPTDPTRVHLLGSGQF
jgi:UDP-N-acetyl-D-glucosamine dehydrogenase